MSVDEFGQTRGIGLIAYVPGLQPRELRVARSRARFGHFGQAEVDRIGEDGRQKRYPVLGYFATLQVRKVFGETGPVVDLKKQFGDPDVGE